MITLVPTKDAFVQLLFVHVSLLLHLEVEGAH